MAIDLNFNEEQELIRNSARQFFAQHMTPADVRRLWNAPEDLPAALWSKMAELGWLAMGAPEADGGMGSGVLDLYPLYLELGRSLAPVPHLETVVIAAGLIAELGSAAQKAAWLPAIAEGRSLVVPALMEPDGLYGEAGIQLAAAGSSLSGVKLLVGFAGAAERLIVAARSQGGVSLFLVDPKAQGVSLERTANSGGLPLYAVTFNGAPGEPLGVAGQAWPTLETILAKAAVLQSAMIVGAGERVLEIAVDYAKTRVQFGEPIGRHQAVQYLVTDVAIHGHNAGLLALHAAWRIDQGLAFKREAAFAKASASRAIAAMTHAAHEVHAGIGFMLDYDLQLYTLRGKHWEFNLGDERHSLETAAGAA